MACPSCHRKIRIVGRFEKRQAADVVEMCVCKQKIEGPGSCAAQFQSKISGARSAIDQHERITSAQFKTGGFTAVAQSILTGCRRRPAYSPTP
jgi:hypothetical protein